MTGHQQVSAVVPCESPATDTTTAEVGGPTPLGKEPGPLTSPPPRRRRPKDIGTAAETAVVRYLVANGFPYAERRAQKGALDEGDITGTPGVCWEVKARNRPPSDGDITGWLVETEIECANAGADLGVLVIRRAGFGPANAGSWWTVMRGNDWILGEFDFPIRLLLSDLVVLLRGAGYGDPLPEGVTG